MAGNTDKKPKGGTSCLTMFFTIVVAVCAIFVGILYHLGMLDNTDKPHLLNIMNKHDEGEIAERVKKFDAKQQYGEDTDEDKRDVAMVDHYYTLATDFYEYGWGESFHFAHTKIGEAHQHAIVRHEEYLIDQTPAKKGNKVLDVGCGVGGPARNIARHSGAHITGITINAYQIKRAENLTEAAGLSDQIDFVQGDFTKMPFANNVFDHAYAIEATCHAPELSDVYSEVARVLKPGGIFVSYEWIETDEADANNQKHQDVLRQIEYGNGLPKLRSLTQVRAAARKAGLEFLSERDLAQDHDGTVPWYDELELIRTWKARLTDFFCVVLETLGLSPPGTVDAHRVLLHAAHGLIDGGEMNIFTPMHLVVMQKPNEAPQAKRAPQVLQVKKDTDKVTVNDVKKVPINDNE